MNQELHKQEVLLAAQREQELLAQKQAAQEKQVPSPNSVFRQLIEEICGTKVCEDQKQNMEDTMLDLLEICRQKELYCIHNNVDDLIESALNSKLLLINLNSVSIRKSMKLRISQSRQLNDTSGSDSVCVLPSSDDFSPIFEEKSVTFSNPLFDSNDFTSRDNELLSDEDIPEDVLENIESKESYVSNLDEPTLLVTPLSDANKDECFDPGGVINEIGAFLDMGISTVIENGYHDSEGDIIYF
ncbi:hypothetical protein Tco_0448910 [Tanacetum coccineum]